MFGKSPMTCFTDLPPEIVARNVPLAPLTWFRLGGPAEYLIRPRSVDELRAVIRAAREADMPLRIFGLGANLLVPDEGVRGVVLRLDQGEFARYDVNEGFAGGGVDMTELTRSAVRAGRAGLEQLAGIPGTVGGGIAMNCGGKYGDIAKAVRSVELMNSDGDIETIEHERMGFAYRQSDIGERFVVGVRFELAPTDPETLKQRYREIWDYKQQTQPAMSGHSAGCIFRNPDGDSAGRIIDRAGLKGFRIGSAFISEQHANFAMADRGGSARDVRELIQTIRTRVFESSGVELEPEVKIW